MNNRQTYTGFKTQPANINEILVFGSNTQGRHGKGAALNARLAWGAKYSNPSGRQGQSYAIITKDLTKRYHPSISKEHIRVQIDQLYKYAKLNNDLRFFVAYIGDPTDVNVTNLNGYTSTEMSFMFAVNADDIAFDIPTNIVFEKVFDHMVHNFNQLYTKT